jgi:DNA primase
MMTRLAQRFGIKEETLWNRLKEFRANQQTESAPETKINGSETSEKKPIRQAPAPRHEIELLEVLLSEPRLVAEARNQLPAEQVTHPGLRQLLEAMYRLLAEGEPPTLENVRARIDNSALLAWAMEHQEVGLANQERKAWLERILKHFRELHEQTQKQELKQQMHSASDHASALELLRKLQNRTSS